MGMFDEVEIDENASIIPAEYRLSGYQTKDLENRLDFYRVDATGLFLKIESGTNKVLHSKNLNQDIECYSLTRSLILQVRCGEVKSVELSNRDANYWDGAEPIWEEFLDLLT